MHKVKQFYFDKEYDNEDEMISSIDDFVLNINEIPKSPKRMKQLKKMVQCIADFGKNINVLFLALTIIIGYTLTAQVAVSTDGSDADPSAMLEVKSTDKGFLPPRMTQVQIEAIETPANGLMVFNTTNNRLYICFEAAGQWSELATGSGIIGSSFTCGEALYDIRDNQSYATILYGTQCWMVENLNVGTKIIGEANQTNNGNIEKYCMADLETNCDTYGGLYQWNELMQNASLEGVQGICPLGWHIPTESEWQSLIEYHNTPAYICENGSLLLAKAFASNTNWIGYGDWCSPDWNTPTNNATGFNGLPAGYRMEDGTLTDLETVAYWWTSSAADASNAAYRRIRSDDMGVWGESSSLAISRGHSIRCIKD